MSPQQAAQALWAAVADMAQALGPEPPAGPTQAQATVQTLTHYATKLLGEVAP